MNICTYFRSVISQSVSYYSFLICRRMGWDYRSAARAGLLHDLYFYDWRTKKYIRSGHASWHPRVALDNASLKGAVCLFGMIISQTQSNLHKKFIKNLHKKQSGIKNFFNARLFLQIAAQISADWMRISCWQNIRNVLGRFWKMSRCRSSTGSPRARQGKQKIPPLSRRLPPPSCRL